MALEVPHFVAKVLAIKMSPTEVQANKLLNSFVALKLMNNDVVSYVYSKKLTTHCVLFTEKSSNLSNSNLEKLLSGYDVEITNDYDQCRSFH